MDDVFVRPYFLYSTVDTAGYNYLDEFFFFWFVCFWSHLSSCHCQNGLPQIVLEASVERIKWFFRKRMYICIRMHTPTDAYVRTHTHTEGLADIMPDMLISPPGWIHKSQCECRPSRQSVMWLWSHCYLLCSAGPQLQGKKGNLFPAVGRKSICGRTRGTRSLKPFRATHCARPNILLLYCIFPLRFEMLWKAPTLRLWINF